MATLSETPEYKILYFKTAKEANDVTSATSGANGFSVMTPDLATETMSIPDVKWSSVDTTWIPDLANNAPAQVYSDDCGMYIDVGRVTIDGENWT